MSDQTTERPSPQWLEAQRQAALSALTAAKEALDAEHIGGAETQLMLVEMHLLAMAPGGAK